jgi:hypothetical protein
MSDPITAAMVGAGISGGTSLLKGKGLGKSLQDAAIGGVLGGAGGALGGALGGASGAAGAAGSTAGTAAGTTAGTTAGTAAGTGAGTAAGAGTIESAGLVFNPATGTYLNPSYFAGATSGMPLYTGAGSTLSQIGTGLGSLGSEINTGLSNLGGSALESLKANPVQAAGLGLNVYDRMNQQPQQMQGQQLGIIRPQQSGQYKPVLNTMLQKRNPYSLLG